MVMETPHQGNPKSNLAPSNPAAAEAHIKGAHKILMALQEKIGKHPEIGAAITKLEMALNDLAVQTGGVL
jgi:hypothetical protein